ncbi:hypothetical protein [Pedobacter sp. GR22-6]|uniref:hypothetical protein n=1 Tax=Pedobacter sp. GR22-6 TaxID=3127957 RepID=UPI00307EF579
MPATITQQTIKTDDLKAIDWLDNDIVDWVSGGQLYPMDGQQSRIAKWHYPFSFDASITSLDGQYAFIYKRLGTKGILLKNGEMLREINRTYYCAEAYEFPAAFLTFNQRTYLIHCPIDYCRLDFEDVETGEIITDIPGRDPSDVFHSRLSISPDNRYLMVCGWVWHPLSCVELFNISECFSNPLLLDQSSISPKYGTEINSATFIDNERILIAASDEEPFDDENEPILPQKNLAVWSFKTNELTAPVKVKGEFGNLFAIDEKRAWDTFKYPKIINIQTGDIECELDHINSGEQLSSMFYGNIEKYPQISFNRKSAAIAIKISSTELKVFTYK